MAPRGATPGTKRIRGPFPERDDRGAWQNTPVMPVPGRLGYRNYQWESATEGDTVSERKKETLMNVLPALHGTHSPSLPCHKQS